MKPCTFEYYKPSSMEEALDLMHQYGGEAKILAGGQSLVPAMNFRLATPGILIDINGLQDLSYIKEHRKHGVLIGAMARYSELEKSDVVAKKCPLLHETIPYIAHPQIRNRGTMGGSLVHADPAAELPAVMLALDASLRLRNKDGERVVAITDFFTGMFGTAMKEDEILTEVAIPHMPKRYGFAFDEVSRRHGDYAMVGVAVSLNVDRKGRCEKGKIVFFSVGDAPVFAEKASQLLDKQNVSEELLENIANVASSEDIEPGSDIHASADYRRHLAKVLTKKTLKRAFDKALA
ncbi:FAD binding domain-containing protein [Candidatus Uabimicrobium amorphum]|uniref:Carbon monoxide dehydrogenase n=1 Tax=Uabimicrobium amorphum TaxID=2596890 RepID=A0A5S9ITF9_UABAM|nr:xanthine dehydrogenase family protein subunit M [Candidatus Uabimicrobium amorphum]BBM87437.1 carbon monoxide dehydrogenase [Candidatus Uabimicrobium amorphum]